MVVQNTRAKLYSVQLDVIRGGESKKKELEGIV